jgi:hypothetical protein
MRVATSGPPRGQAALRVVEDALALGVQVVDGDHLDDDDAGRKRKGSQPLDRLSRVIGAIGRDEHTFDNTFYAGHPGPRSNPVIAACPAAGALTMAERRARLPDVLYAPRRASRFADVVSSHVVSTTRGNR